MDKFYYLWEHQGERRGTKGNEGERWVGEVKSILPRTGGGGGGWGERGGDAQSVRTPSNFLLKNCFHK